MKSHMVYFTGIVITPANRVITNINIRMDFTDTGTQKGLSAQKVVQGLHQQQANSTGPFRR
jgi:hypothetical protein